MSVSAFVEAQRAILAKEPPEAWAIILNSVYGQAESESIAAVFDTEQMARAYYEASKLPKERVGEMVDGKRRNFRAESVLFDFNNCRSSRHWELERENLIVRVRNVILDLSEYPANPVLP